MCNCVYAYGCVISYLIPSGFVENHGHGVELEDQFEGVLQLGVFLSLHHCRRHHCVTCGWRFPKL